MLKFPLCFIILVLLCTRVEADFILAPETLFPGGVALLCWQGPETPHDLLKVTFSNTVQPLLQRDNRPCALVGVDLDQAPGLWPLTVESVAPSGTRHLAQLSLRIEGVERPSQKLSLPKQMVTPTETKFVQQIERDRKRLDQVFKRRQPIHFSPPFLRPVDGEVISAFGLR
ncbi:MAG: hypothetical protein Q7U44_06150, partial [Desulfuromonadales bacterium]|nr:hypothetical protein [Desulfuromonadales bacterium]